MKKIIRRYPVGAELVPKMGVHFQVWAPDHNTLELAIENEEEPHLYTMEKEADGYFSLLVPEAGVGTLYRYIIDGMPHSDPASRFQPLGTSGPSQVIDPTYSWTDAAWKGSYAHGQIIYEMHIGTYTEEGTFQAAKNHLHELHELGITLIEIMPVNAFPGQFGWGYDGVNLFSPSQLYGTPADLKDLVNRAHELGMGVVLDVVYNHIGVEDNHMTSFAKSYLSEKHISDWGSAVNFDSEQSAEFFLTNAKYWIEEFHFDGLRLDATPWILSTTEEHALSKFSKVIRAAGGKKNVLVIGENENQDTTLLRPHSEGGYGFDMLWNDDFHHAACVRLTGKREAYYIDYLGSPQEFISSLKYGFLYQGQYHQWKKSSRGGRHFKMPREAMIVFLENHDQIGNTATGQRLHQKSDPGNYRALTALFLLSPNTPMIFQGQEYNSLQPFHYFSDHSQEINKLIYEGRKKELTRFPRFSSQEVQSGLIDPSNIQFFKECKLNRQQKDQQMYALFKDLIELRKKDPIFNKIESCQVDGAVLGPDSFLIRYFNEEHGDRLLLVNFGIEQNLNPVPEPLLAPAGDGFDLLWSSESPLYGGEGIPPLTIPSWNLPGHSAMLLKSKRLK